MEIAITNYRIERVFYCAGYIESWGRRIQKICDACKNFGANDPVYPVHGEDIMVKFHAQMKDRQLRIEHFKSL